MEVNNFSGRSGKTRAIPRVAWNVHILLVDHNTISLMSLASQFEQQLYKVTTTESASIALSLFRARENHYDIVIADRCMPEMNIYEFVHKVRCHRMNTPIILIAENFTVAFATEAFDNGVCYLFSKPPTHRDIENVWQHIFRVTGIMPSATETNYIDVEKYGNPSNGSSSDGAARNQERSNLRRNIINPDRGNMKRRNNPIAEADSNSSKDSNVDNGLNSKKSCMTWTPSLEGAQSKILLRTMNEPSLTHSHVSSHLQAYGDGKRYSLNLQKTASPVMPTVLPAAPMSMQGQTSGAANFNYMAARGAPNFVVHSLDSLKEKLDALKYSGNNENRSANIGEQAQVFPQSFGHLTMEGYHLSNGLQAPNHEPAGATLGVIPSTGLMSNSYQSPNNEPAGATGDVLLASGHLSNGLQAPNRESAADFGMGMYGLGNVGNRANMNNVNFEEDTSANLQFDGMPSYDYWSNHTGG